MRLSGPRAFAALKALAPALVPRPRLAHRVRLVDPETALPIDDGLALTFPSPASFTGEDVVELHVHGSPAVLETLVHVLSRQGLRAAEAGAFTKRAFANGKMDLTAAEGLADLIASDSDSQRLQALDQMGGAWAGRIVGWRAQLLDALAWLEADIDFADEDDVPSDVAHRARDGIEAVAAGIGAVLDDGRRGEIIRDGLRVAIVGPPNVGKSTLLNALAGRDVAIVTDIAGTTRDVLEVRLDIAGYVVVVADTAGLRETGDVIEAEGVRRARQRADEAHLRIWVIDGTSQGEEYRVGLETDEAFRAGDVVFWNKADRPDFAGTAATDDIVGAARSGQGIDALLGVVAAHVKALSGHGTLIVRARHREALMEAQAALQRSEGAVPDLAAEDVRVALAALGRILGRFDVEAVLDRIFSAFCIGK